MRRTKRVYAIQMGTIMGYASKYATASTATMSSELPENANPDDYSEYLSKAYYSCLGIPLTKQVGKDGGHFHENTLE